MNPLSRNPKTFKHQEVSEGRLKYGGLIGSNLIDRILNTDLLAKEVRKSRYLLLLELLPGSCELIMIYHF